MKRKLLFCLAVNLIFISCTARRDILKELIELKYDFENISYQELYASFLNSGFRPVGSEVSWNKKVLGSLCSIWVDIEQKKVILSFSDYRKFKKIKGIKFQTIR
jgi:hypothetical protein